MIVTRDSNTKTLTLRAACEPLGRRSQVEEWLVYCSAFCSPGVAPAKGTYLKMGN